MNLDWTFDRLPHLQNKFSVCSKFASKKSIIFQVGLSLFKHFYFLAASDSKLQISRIFFLHTSVAFLETPFRVAFKCFYFQKGFQERSKGFILNAYYCTCNSLQRGPINFYTRMFRISHIIEQSALSRQPYYAWRWRPFLAFSMY